MIISHILSIGDDRKDWLLQSNDVHSAGVAELSSKFASEFDMSEWGKVLGLLHDKGKEKFAFQQHIMKSSGYNPDVKVEGDSSHAYVGGLIAKVLYPYQNPLLVNPLMGHHRGLYDYADLNKELSKTIPTEVNANSVNIELALPKNAKTWQPKDFHHLMRMLYSCLVDADFLDTENFMMHEQSRLRESKSSLMELYPLLQDYLDNLKKNAKATAVNKIRQEIQDACIRESEGETGFYSLTVPTGGGKTLSSLLWAFKHAIKNGKKRIIIAIPYTSIIVQTASILRNIFGERNVLEHHSNVDPDKLKDGGNKDKLKLATENWDAPIIVTTNVQLFESMFASHSSRCRKLHNICKSVLILDEVQTLPTDFLQPIVDSLDTYKRLFDVSVLFTTASQPVLEGTHIGVNPRVKLEGLENIKEIIPSNANLHDRLRRVKLVFKDEYPSTYDDIVDEIAQYDRVLCVVNTRRDAKEIFERLPNDGINIHLSRMMCPAHISKEIERIRTSLEDSTNKVVRVVSTQLIEAGVDIDFPVVFRQEAGLDSILQAAGRCNREGKQQMGTTYVFSLSKEHSLPKGFITQTNNARKNMGKDYDWFSPKAMNDYFLQLYSRVHSFDKQDMNYYLNNNIEQLLMETAAEKFKLIDDTTVPVIVNKSDEGVCDLVQHLIKFGPSYSLMKKLSAFSVNISRRLLDDLKKEGIVDEILEGVYFVPNSSQYSDSIGLLTENQLLEETFVV
ncbi:MAG: CRISPR-associated helicase Cas3' [Paludibacteraceae bacterium]|nr:CRISPR-associated helicase Cas3' [Paludibacteraceae bacterium]